jgi:hypothetical protein
MISAQFHHGNLMMRLHPQKCCRHTNGVIETGFTMECIDLSTENGRQHILGGGLAVRSGNGNDWQIKLVSVCRAQLAQGLASIRDY